MIFILFLTLLSCSSLNDNQLLRSQPIRKQVDPFKSDGCSFFPEGTKTQKKMWLRCCVIHDYKYWKGGTKNERLIADNQLKKCVKNYNKDIIAKMMYLGTRIGGDPKYEASFSWGYGWKYNKGYEKLNDEEIQFLKKIGPKQGEDLRKYIDTKSGSLRELDLDNEIIF